MSTSAPTEHFFSVDVEDFFHAHVFERLIPRDRWGTQASRVQGATQVLLDLLERHRITGTFFTLGWVAERHPGLVQRIAGAGHEIASHTWWHPKITILQQQSGQPVNGFRAPSFSILRGLEWTFDILLEEGYRYDSSLFPIRRPGYGYAAGRTTVHEIVRPSGTLLELPPATLPILGVRLPAAGGGYLRQLPLGIIRRALQRFQRAGEPAMVYIHPWDLDADQPRLPLPLVSRVRHYRGLGSAMTRLERLLEEFRFTSVAHWLAGRTG